MAEEKIIDDEEEKKKKELAELENQQRISITSANQNFFNNEPNVDAENNQPINPSASKGNSETEQKIAVPKLPEGDFSVADKYIKISKYCEAASYWSKIMPWIFIPLAIGAMMTGLGVLSLVFVAIASVSIITIYAGSEFKDVFEDLAIKEEKGVVEKNKTNLQEYYKKCEELNIEPLSPNAKLKDKDKAKITEAQQRALDQTCQQQAAQAAKQAQQAAEQSK